MKAFSCFACFVLVLMLLAVGTQTLVNLGVLGRKAAKSSDVVILYEDERWICRVRYDNRPEWHDKRNYTLHRGFPYRIVDAPEWEPTARAARTDIRLWHIEQKIGQAVEHPAMPLPESPQ